MGSMKISLNVLLLAVFGLCAPRNGLAGTSDLQSSVVKVLTGYRTPDYTQPWNMTYQKARSGSGFIVDGHRIMTNAHVVGDQVYLQVQKVGDTKKYTANVEYVAHDCEIALLKVQDESFFQGTQPVHFGGIPLQRDHVAAFGFPTGGEQLIITEGIVSRVEVQSYMHSLREILAIQIDAPINPGNSGGPVFKGGDVVGISFQAYGSSQNIAYMVPVPVIQRFYADIRDGRYDGYPELGISWQRMENPDLRTVSGLTPEQGGIRITRIQYQSSAWGVLQEGDVIVAFAGTPVARDGTVELRHNERVRYNWLLNAYQLGDSVKIDILRDGHPTQVTVKLVQTKYLVPRATYEAKPTWLEFAGIIFMPLTQDYMDQWEWNQVDPDFRVFFMTGLMTPERRQVVIVNQVLPHDINIGYQDLGREVVGRVNGRSIGDMTELAAALSSPVGGVDTIEFADLSGKGRRLVFDAKKVADAAPDLVKRFGLPGDRSEDLSAMTVRKEH